MCIDPNHGHILAVVQMTIDRSDRDRMISAERYAQPIVIQHLRHLLGRYLLDVIDQASFTDRFGPQTDTLLALALVERYTDDSNAFIVHNFTETILTLLAQNFHGTTSSRMCSTAPLYRGRVIE
uniref:Uncharacterized protein n=1 Tax=Anopheles melas TaxID=34690 RepID=A0A182ULH1_9DIPT